MSSVCPYVLLGSRYGEIVDVNLVRDKSTGKSKGFAFLAYEDQRSTVLAVGESSGEHRRGTPVHAAAHSFRLRRIACTVGARPSTLGAFLWRMFMALGAAGAHPACQEVALQGLGPASFPPCFCSC